MLNDTNTPVCPNCGSKSLYFGVASTTAAYYQPFTDDAGRVHHHNGNTITQEYICRKCSTRFTEKTKNGCWCGWKDLWTCV